MRAATVISLVLLLALAGCGSSGSDSNSVEHRDGGAQEFKVHGSDNSVPEFGEEAPASEVAEAARVLHGYLNARAEQDWATACRYLSPAFTGSLVKTLGLDKAKSKCAPLIASLLTTETETLRESAVAEVGAFRVGGNYGFILFHGARGVDYFLPMRQEDGRWWVAAIGPSAFT